MLKPFRDGKAHGAHGDPGSATPHLRLVSSRSYRAMLGYIGLAIFVSLQVVVTGTMLLTAYIGFLSSRAISDEGGFAETSIGRWLTRIPVPRRRRSTNSDWSSAWRSI